MRMQKMKKVNNYVASKKISDEMTKLYLYGDISDFYENDINARNVQEELLAIESDEVEVHINSYGGDLFEGIAIHNILKNSGKKIKVVVDGIAASAASIIAMAGTKIIMPKNAEMMIHNPWTFAYGNAEDLRKIADELETHQTVLEECYLDRFKGTREELQDLLTEEKFLTAEEAIEFGLCDEIATEEKKEEPEDQGNQGAENEAPKKTFNKKILKLFS